MKWLLIVLLVVMGLAAVYFFQSPMGKRGRVGSGSDLLAGARVKAAEFTGGGPWLNTEELTGEEGGVLTIAGLLAREEVDAVLVDFWTYSCINCQRTIPYLKSWWDKYNDKGLVIVGVHSPEFEFEKDTDNVKAAMAKYGVTWPVVQDNEMAIWRAYGNNYWPHKYLVNKRGEIVYDHIGEGAYEETERRIQELLGVSDMEVTEEPQSGGVQFGMPFGGAQGEGQTPELYVNQRGQQAGQLGKGQDTVELIGNWQIEEDFAVAGKGASLRLPFKAASMNLVMSTAGGQGLEVAVRIDGGEERLIEIVENDLYSLWEGEFGNHTLEMTVDQGVRLHAFTFGS